MMTIDQVAMLPPALSPWELAFAELPGQGAHRLLVVVERKGGQPRWAKFVSDETDLWPAIEAACHGHSSTTPQRPIFLITKDPKLADQLRRLLEPLRVMVTVGPVPAADAGAALLSEHPNGPPGDTLLAFTRAIFGDEFDVGRPIDDVLADVDWAARVWNATVQRDPQALADSPRERVAEATMAKLGGFGDDERIFEDVTIRRTLDEQIVVTATAR